MNYNAYRRKSRTVRFGGIAVGGETPVTVQSMTNTDTHDSAATLAQVRALAAAGCDIVRLAVPDMAAADTIAAIKAAGVTVPLVADIHFDYRIALASVRAGVDKLRINPGNIGGDERVREVAVAAAAAGIPIRIGVNGGSLEPAILKKHGHPCAQALAESALSHAELLEKHAFSDIVISIKSSNVRDMIAANRLLAEQCDYPLHLGVTEAGTPGQGVLKNAMGIGALLCDGIGDTLRVSLTADPLQEVEAGKAVLRAAGCSAKRGLTVVSCPTCGRTRIDLIGAAERFEKAAEEAGLNDVPVKVAIMGCAVNGPGEAREADLGIAGGIGEALLFAHGEILRKVPEDKIIETLIGEIQKGISEGTFTK